MMQDNMTRGERSLDAYLQELRRFDDDPAVAYQLTRASRNCLFRSLAYPPEYIDLVLQRVKEIAEIYSAAEGEQADNLRIQAAESPGIAGGAVAAARHAEALARLEDLRDITASLNLADSEARRITLSLLHYVIQSAGDKYPVAAFSVWNDVVSALPGSSPGQDDISSWVHLACQLAENLAKADRLASFAVWSRAVAWTASLDPTPEDVTFLIGVAYLLIERSPDGDLRQNDVLWAFVRSAELGRQGPRSDEGKLASIRAAIDIVWAESESLNRLLYARLPRLLEIGAATPTSDGKAAQFNVEAARKDPDLAAEIDRLTAPIRQILDRAEGWIDDQLVWLPAWPQVINGMREFTRKRGEYLAEAFSRKAQDVNQNARRRGAEAAVDALRIAAEPAPWFMPPLAPLGWSDITDETEIRKLVSRLLLPGAPLHDEDVQVERVRITHPSFYPDEVLVEAQVLLHDKDRGEQQRGIVYWLPLLHEQSLIFDGTSPGIHMINKAGYLQGLDDLQVVLDYALFFCSSLWGESGQDSSPFRVVRSLDEMLFVDPPDDELAAEIREKLVANPQPVFDPISEKWRIEATMVFEENLYDFFIEVQRNGMIEMLTEKPLLEDLPVTLLERRDGIRFLRA